MAYNNDNDQSGYPYQYQQQAQQSWQTNYGQQGQVPVNGQGIQQRVPQQQFQQQGYQVPRQQGYSQPPSPQVQIPQQQYQYRSMPSPIQYSAGLPQYHPNGSPYRQPQQQQQAFPSPQQQYQTYPSPQLHNQYAQVQNQYISAVPQRQLSYSQPQPQQPHRSPSIDSFHGRQSPMQAPQPLHHMPTYSVQRATPDLAHMNSRPSQSPIMASPRNISRPLSASQQPVPPQVHVLSSSPSYNNPNPGVSRPSSGSPMVSRTNSISSNTVRSGSEAQSRPQGVKFEPTLIKDEPADYSAVPRSTTSQVSQHQVKFHARPAEPARPAASHTNSLPQQIRPQPQSAITKPVVSQASARPVLQAVAPNQKIPKAISRPDSPALVKPIIEEVVSEPVEEIDYALLLIDLAEEYFDAAYGKASGDSPARREPDLNIFYKLISTGLGCLEMVLKRWSTSLQPAVEAAVRLQYATILHAETDNTSQAEEVLSVGIAHCDRLRLNNLKYNMQHLLTRITFTTNPKAAANFLDLAIKDAEIEQHIPWIYAFRFLRASLSLDVQKAHETSQALSQLKLIRDLARSRGDVAVAATASAIEAMTYINRASTMESIDQAQAALATVRTAENNPNVPRIPQLTIMAYFVDLMCSLFKADLETACKKMKSMHESVDEFSEHTSWNDDSTFLVPIGQQSTKTMPGVSTHGAVVLQYSEKMCLKLSWMPKNELLALGNMFSAATIMQKASAVDKCRSYLDNAEAYLRLIDRLSPDSAKVKLNEDLACHLQILRVFASCSRNAWGDAKKDLNSLKVKMAGINDTTKSSLSASIIYLEGMIAQGTGDPTTALALYSNPMLSLDNIENSARKPAIIRDLSTLAALNTVLIIHRPSHPQHHKMEGILAALEGLDTTNPSGNMRGAYFLIRALRSDTNQDMNSNPILTTKNNLREVLQIAKQTGNSQFSCISLTFMTDRFFKGLIGDQAHKSALTALNLAQRGKNDLWTSVASSLLAGCLETRGEIAEAEVKRREALQLAMRLPVSMQVAAAEAT